MTYLGIGSPIPTLKTLRESTVTLNYPVANACEQDNTAVAPSIKEPAGGTFSATPSGLSIDSNGVITPSSSTVGTYTVLYTASGSSASFTFDIVADKASGFSYGSSSLQQSGYATPTFDSGVESGGTFTYSSSNSGNLSITQNQNSNDNGRIDLSNSDIDTYSISYTSPGPCSTTTTISLEIVAAYASTSSFYFDGVNDYFQTELNLAHTAVPNLTLSCWIKMNNSDLTNFISYSPVGVYTNQFGNGSAMNIYKNLAGSRVSVQGQGTPTISYGTTDLGDNNWHNIISTYAYDSAGTVVNVYVDGNSTPEISNKLLNSYAPLSGNLYIGAVIPGFRHFKGNVDEVSAWNTILSTDAITEIFNEQQSGSGKPNDLTSLTHASSSNLVAWYKMGE